MWKRKMIETKRGIFEVFVQGEGEAVCITHLYSEFNELGYYFADAFVHAFKVYLVNLKGAGRSSKPVVGAEMSMKESVGDLEAIREELGLEQWGFAGHSTGGMLGLVYATCFPDSLSKIMVGGATATNKYMEHEGSMYSPSSPLNKKWKEIFYIMESSQHTIEKKRAANREWTDMSLYNKRKRDGYFQKPSSGRVVQRRLNYFSFYDLPSFDIQDELARVSIPAIVYCGRHDAQCPFIFSEDIDARLKNSKLYIFEESNHFPYLEEKEGFMTMVSDFMKRN
ncbi:alpha/beta hydrolase [Peribacillus muralis]|uniref:Alpha/beta hydrolase n=1 Tax=Peribacillus muralis TaxID=264697 RepID=A0A1B3XJW6_9BACI|nr:alpha/beta hydrolase [Peribacillus muralis]AOH53507.1 alpha/beta hydrolase [Peribacillus muralis]